MFWGGQCCETSAVLFMPVLAHFGRFGAFSRQSGPTDRPDAERPLNRKFGKNKCRPVRGGSGRPERFFEKLSSFFW